MYSGEKPVYRSSLLERRRNSGISLAGSGKAPKKVLHYNNGEAHKTGGVILRKYTPQLQVRVDVIAEGGLEFTGVVESYTDSTMVIGRQVGMFRLPVIPEGSKLSLKHYIPDKGYDLCECVVVKSNILELVVAGIKVSREINRRSSTRIRVHSAKAEIYESKKDYLRTKVVCNLIDINMDGARISCTKEYQEGYTMLLRVELYPDAGFITLPAVVVRCDMVDGMFEYGLLFAKLSPDKKKILEGDLGEAMYYNSI